MATKFVIVLNAISVSLFDQGIFWWAIEFCSAKGERISGVTWKLWHVHNWQIFDEAWKIVFPSNSAKVFEQKTERYSWLGDKIWKHPWFFQKILDNYQNKKAFIGKKTKKCHIEKSLGNRCCLMARNSPLRCTMNDLIYHHAKWGEESDGKSISRETFLPSSTASVSGKRNVLCGRISLCEIVFVRASTLLSICSRHLSVDFGLHEILGVLRWWNKFW